MYKDKQTAEVYRLWYNELNWYKQSWYVSTWNTYNWHLKALTIKDWIEKESFWKEYEFHTNKDADIKESDRLIINWDNYDVKGVSDFYGEVLNRKIVYLNK